MKQRRESYGLLGVPAILLALFCSERDSRADRLFGYVPSLNARVTSLSFFEDGSEPAPPDQRAYRKRFDASKTRYVYWDLELDHPAPRRRAAATIEEIWQHADGTPIARQSMQVVVVPEWPTSNWHHSHNLISAGGRYLGIHRVDLYVAGQKIASNVFEVYDADCDGRVQFKEARKVREYEHLLDTLRSNGDSGARREALSKLGTAYHHWALTCHMNGNLEAALAGYDKVLSMFPEDAVVYQNRGNLRTELGDRRGAIEDYDRAIRIDPKYAEYYDSRGVARFQLWDFIGAMRDLDEAIRLDPTNARFHEHRGVIRAHSGKNAEAIQDLEQAASLYESAEDRGRVSESISRVKSDRGNTLAIEEVRSVRS